MPAALRIDSIKRKDAAGLAAHALRLGHSEGHIDRSLSHLNRVMVGEDFRPGHDPNDENEYDLSRFKGILPEYQPNGRKVRTDANLMAQGVATLPAEFDKDDDEQVSRWSEATLEWAREQTGKLTYAVLHLDEPGCRPHMHMAWLAVKPDGHLSYTDTWGGPPQVARLKMLALQQSYSAAVKGCAERWGFKRVADVGANPEAPYYTKGINGWRELKRRTALRKEDRAKFDEEMRAYDKRLKKLDAQLRKERGEAEFQAMQQAEKDAAMQAFLDELQAREAQRLTALLEAQELAELRYYLAHNEPEDFEDIERWLTDVTEQHKAAVGQLNFKESERLRNYIDGEVERERKRCDLTKEIDAADAAEESPAPMAQHEKTAGPTPGGM